MDEVHLGEHPFLIHIAYSRKYSGKFFGWWALNFLELVL
jgi:hypothetical protein